MGQDLVKGTGAIKAVEIALGRRCFNLCLPGRSVKLQRIGRGIRQDFNHSFIINSLTTDIRYTSSDGSPQYGFHSVMTGSVSHIKSILALTIFQNRIGSCIQQNLADFHMATDGSEHQQRGTVVILPVDITAALEMKSNQIRCTDTNSHFDEGIHNFRLGKRVVL
ncbi:MAG TPA: hypothetical protein PL166_00375 [Candidatus Contendobacter sp.]|nr:hypothetical protein [Candidatus Contendobacter sp.]